MSLTSHVGILLGHSLDVARLNKKKTRADFYAQIAFPPAALGELANLVTAIYPGVALNTLEVNINTNAAQAKPFVGIPADWYVIRMASQFAPELYEANGTTQIPTATARQRFYSGMRVRVHSSAWGWKNEFGKSGASFNLLGLMDAGEGGDRLAIGGAQAGAAFAAHANPNAVSQTANAFAAQTAAAPAQQTTPFAAAPAQQSQVVAQSAAPAASANPFAQPVATANNPFATAA